MTPEKKIQPRESRAPGPAQALGDGQNKTPALPVFLRPLGPVGGPGSNKEKNSSALHRSKKSSIVDASTEPVLFTELTLLQRLNLILRFRMLRSATAYREAPRLWNFNEGLRVLKECQQYCAARQLGLLWH
jgi:hypothetical protein